MGMKAINARQRLIQAAGGAKKADLVLKNAVYVNVFSNELCRGDIAISEGVIAGIGQYSGIAETDVSGKIVCPGLIDGHIHLESAAVTPSEFAKAVLPHGTTAVVADPHEIANVMGTHGIDYILQASEQLPLDVFLMLPSCVPATALEESGADLDYLAIESFYKNPRILGLAEMMDYSGVIRARPDILEKTESALLHGRQIDGHAPDLSGNPLNAYIAAGIYSDHECTDYENALEKLRKGQYIMIREGTAAKNLEALLPLLTPQYASRCLFVTDDKHPNDLLNLGHIDAIIRKAVNLGADPILAVKAASFNAAQYFRLTGRGAVAPGYRADLIIADNLQSFAVETVYKDGKAVFSGSRLSFTPPTMPKVDSALLARALDTFHMDAAKPADFTVTSPHPVIGMIPGQIMTENSGYAEKPDTTNDIVKLAVLERHRNTHHIGIGFLKGYGLKKGAVATSISHDSHNLIVAGCNDGDMALAANRVAENKGGIVVAADNRILAELPLPIAGLMSDKSLSEVNDRLEQAKKAAVELGVSSGVDPFMTLSFMSLPVLPALRLTTKGMVNVTTQTYC